MANSKVLPCTDTDFVAEKSRASSAPIGNVELLLCVGMCVGIVSAYILLKKGDVNWTHIAAAVVGCFIAAVLVAYAVWVGTSVIVRKTYDKNSKEESIKSAKRIEMESPCIGSESTLDEDYEERDDEHSEDCTSCMPNLASELISGRYADIVGKVDVRQEYGIESNYGEDASIAAMQVLEAQSIKKASDASVDSSNESGDKRRSIDLESYEVHGKIQERCDHVICSIKEGNRGLFSYVVQKWKSGGVRLTRDRENGKVILSVDGKYAGECILTTHAGGDPFPELGDGVHIVYGVRFQREFKLLRESGVILADDEGISNGMGEDETGYGLLCKVRATLNYDSLVKLMFSQESKNSGNTRRLFLLYLEFYYEALKGYVEIERSFSGDVVTVRSDFIDTYFGAVLAKDIKSHTSEFEKAFAQYRELGDRERRLCDFLRAVQGKMPANLEVHDTTSRSGMLFACMSCIYAVTCSNSTERYFVEDPGTLTKRLLFFVFFNLQPLREALVLQAIADEALYIRNNERRNQSFLSGIIKDLQESTSVLMRILLKPNGQHKQEMENVFRSGSDTAKNIVAALLLEERLSIDVSGINISHQSGDMKECAILREYYMARRGLQRDSCVDHKFDGDHKAAFNFLNEGTEKLVPYAVVDTFIGLTRTHGEEILFTDNTDVNEYVALLDALKSSCIVDFLGPCKSVVAGRELFGRIMSIHAQGIVSPIESSLSAVVAGKDAQHRETSDSVPSSLCAVEASPSEGGGIAAPRTG